MTPTALLRRERRLWPALVAHRAWSETVATVTAVTEPTERKKTK